MIFTQDDMRYFIDHTRLFFSPGEDQNALIVKLCQEAHEHGFYAVCVRPEHVSLAKVILNHSSVRIATVIGFPTKKTTLAAEIPPSIGHIPITQKLQEIKQALLDGCDELDYVIDVATFKTDLKTANYSENLEKELNQIFQAACGKPVKVILETDLLGEKEIRSAIVTCAKARHNQNQLIMVKTSTGAITDGCGAAPQTIRFMANVIHEQALPLRIKASGGIKTFEQANHLLSESTSLRLVSRLGTSNGLDIVKASFSQTSSIK